MKDAFLKTFCFRSLLLYILIFAVVSLSFPASFIGWHYFIWGIGGATFFFCGTFYLNHYWKDFDEKKFVITMFVVAFIIRALYAFLMCYYYTIRNGMPLECTNNDSYMYHQKALALVAFTKQNGIVEVMKILFSGKLMLSDIGYIIILALTYSVFGPNILTPRLLQALFSAYMCVLVYKLSRRIFDSPTAKIAGVISAVMPLFIYYCGIHLKETFFAFFLMLAIERFDLVLKEKKNRIPNILLIGFSVLMVFCFRICTGICLIFAFFVYIFVSKECFISKKNKIICASFLIVLLILIIFGGFGKEILWNIKSAFKLPKYYFQCLPGTFVLPLPKLTGDGSCDQGIKSGMVFAKNIIGFFAMYSFIVAYREKKFREISLLAVVSLTYLAIVSSTRFYSTERYYFPVLPCLVVLSAYGMKNFRKKDLKLFNAYLVVLFVAIFIWSYYNVITSEI